MQADQKMLDLFVHYATERQNVHERRAAGLPQSEWTEDHILRTRRFCNNFRVADYGSQYVLKELLADSPDLPTTLFRAAFYRLTNEPSFWDFMCAQLGGMPTLEHLQDGTVALVMRLAHAANWKIFRGAYLISFGAASKGQKKHEHLAHFLMDHFHPEGLHSVWPRFAAADTLYARICALESISRIGPFLAQQIATDINYSEHHLGTENDRVVLGPGSTKGLRFIYGDSIIPGGNYHHVNGQLKILELRDSLQHITLELPSGATRGLSLLDIQNVLCEFSKYVREVNKLDFRLPEKPSFTVRPGASKLVLPRHWDNESVIV